jgi:chromosome segregation ATPase
MTLEQAQERIIELEGQLAELTTERDSLSQNNESLTRDLENARTVNSRLLARVAQQSTPEDEDGDDPDEPEVPTCEEFAATINII